jgi:NodT family efflux transporter outer membrane factor (OMF) lipoprotein
VLGVGIKGCVLIAALGLAGCAVGPDFKAPARPRDASYTERELPVATVNAPGLGGAAQHFAPGQDIPAQWWTLFQSPEIDGLVRAALANSPTLGAAQATLRQARETLKGNTGGLLLPSLTGQAQATRERPSAITSGAPSGGGFGVPDLNLFNANVNVSYNIDVFGSSRRQIEGYQAQVDYSNYQLEATYLTLTANVVTAGMQEASLRAQLKATQEIADAQAQELDLVQKQFSVGAVARSTVLQQETQLATTRATIPGLEKQLEQTRNQLAVLMGNTPSRAQLPVVTLEGLTLPTELPVSLPSELVRQRPDIKAAEAQLHQASAQVGVATAALLPQFTITAQYGNEASTFGHLLDPASNFWSLAAGITQPIFKGGQLAAQRRAAIAAHDAAWQQYRGTVLQAFQNVADSLVALDEDAKTLAADARADDLARETLEQVQGQYKLGAVSYINLLDAQRQYYQAHVTLVQAQAARFTDTAALFQALGGGWWNRAQPLADISLAESSGRDESNK